MASGSLGRQRSESRVLQLKLTKIFIQVYICTLVDYEPRRLPKRGQWPISDLMHKWMRTYEYSESQSQLREAITVTFSDDNPRDVSQMSVTK